MKEIRELDVTRALRQIENARFEQMLWQCELLQANGMKVFEEGKDKGITRYKEFFNSIEARQKKQESSKPVKIDPENRFMEG